MTKGNKNLRGLFLDIHSEDIYRVWIVVPHTNDTIKFPNHQERLTKATLRRIRRMSERYFTYIMYTYEGDINGYTSTTITISGRKL